MRELPAELRLVAWEVTRRCNLACVHCRASSLFGPYTGELDTQEGTALIDDIVAVGRPVLILTGGEPLLRDDVFTLARYGTDRGLRVVMATNGTLVTDASTAAMREAGIARVSVSLDGADKDGHDAFRGVPGAFAGAIRGIEILKAAGIPFQINTTITRINLEQLPRIHDLAVTLGAAAHHIFLLVPTGRGRELADQAVTPAAYEETLRWFHERSLQSPIDLKATCAPHYYRIAHQRGKRWNAEGLTGEERTLHPLAAMTRGCLGGISFCFISHVGQVQPCGYLEIDCGWIRRDGFAAIWRVSEVFRELRDLTRYKGKCGRCEFVRVCGGCRARAYEETGDYLAAEPYCVYEPKRS